MRKAVVILVGLLAMSFVGCVHNKTKGHSGHHAKMWKMMDANGDDTVTRKEFDAAHNKMFAKMDVNGDGKITKEEKMSCHSSKKSGKKGSCSSCK